MKAMSELTTIFRDTEVTHITLVAQRSGDSPPAVMTVSRLEWLLNSTEQAREDLFRARFAGQAPAWNG